MPARVPRRRQVESVSAAAHIPQLAVRVAAGDFYVPDRVVTNEDLSALGCDSDWIVQRTGIRQRRMAQPHESTSDLAAEAGQRCLAAAGVPGEAVDLIIVATCTPDHVAPSVSCLVQERIGCHWAAAFDINAACSGFMYAYLTAAQFVAMGSYQNVLVIGADVLSRYVDPKDSKTYPLFGDGAAALLLQPSGRAVVSSAGHRVPVAQAGDAGVMGFQLGAEGSLGHSLLFPAGGSRQPLTPEILAAGGQYLQMDGRTVFKWAVQWIPQVVAQLLRQCQLETTDIDLFVLHQANSRIIEAAMASLNIPAEKIWTNLDRYGNTCAASIPVALIEAERAGALKPGQHVLLCGFGAGLTWGAAVVRW
ncbi:MAG: ketoacyl-ACP synthase III [Planctomycetaceae bacterium]|nr:ketoacyl-ACP synthase III [Planctomycetaceae bacterium]